MLMAGLWFLYEQLFVSTITYFKFVMGAGFLVAIGGGWLIGDFIVPLFRKN
jgi:hypothetical protein